MHVGVNGKRLWFDIDGPALVPDGPSMRERPTVVLLHGGPGSFDHSYFKPDFATLAKHAQVIYLDLPGHGRSTWGDPSDWRFETCADAVRAFCDALGLVRPIVFGHSLGSMVAMLYAARHPTHARALVLQSAMARLDLPRTVEAFRKKGGDQVAAVVERFYGGARQSVTAEEWAPCFKLFGPWVPGPKERARTIPNLELNPPGLELMRKFNALDQLARIDCPTLVAVGDLDPITPISAAQEIVSALPTGLARLEVFENAGHFTWKDVPDRYWPILIEFVNRGR
jgi:pimeloyl-ACP methyl ester carboxylesterase